MKLYFSPGTCSQAVHIALREAGLPFTLEKVDLRTRRTGSGADWAALNPKGYVPMLELDEGGSMTEVVALLTYVADRKPDAELAPQPPSIERYRLQEWLAFISSEIHKSFSPLFNAGMPEAGKQIYRDRLANRFQFVDKELQGKDYLMGDNFTVADAYLYTVTRWSKVMSIDISAYANLVAHHARVEARPAVQEALKVEKLA